MARALLYHSPHRWRLGGALCAAAAIHLAAISLANVHKDAATPAGVDYNALAIDLEPDTSTPDPALEVPDTLATPPPTEDSFPTERSTPPSRRSQTDKAMPIVRARINRNPGTLVLSSARALAVSAPPPEYPYEARRQKITGEGVVVITLDPVTGRVTGVSISKTTGSPFLDSAAVVGFKRWRFKPGTASSVTCPVTFTLTGASY
jgi:TonB family protein